MIAEFQQDVNRYYAFCEEQKSGRKHGSYLVDFNNVLISAEGNIISVLNSRPLWGHGIKGP